MKSLRAAADDDDALAGSEAAGIAQDDSLPLSERGVEDQESGDGDDAEEDEARRRRAQAEPEKVGMDGWMAREGGGIRGFAWLEKGAGRRA